MVIRVIASIFCLAVLPGCAGIVNELTRDRGGEVEIPARTTDSVDKAIDRMVSSRKPVSLVIWVGNVSNAGGGSVIQNQEWKSGTARMIALDLEGQYLKEFDGLANFSLVDRSAVDLAISELHFQSTGFTDQKQALSVGKFVNATHVVILEIFRVPHRNYGYIDRTDKRLVDVQTGTVLAVDKKITNASGNVVAEN